MSAKLQKLTFAIDLMERVSAPVKKINRIMNNMATQSEKAFSKIGMGAAGVAGAGLSLMEILNPAEQVRQALGDVDSLDVNQKVLKSLSDKALQYSIKYGRAADGFVSSAYDIQSSIDGLQGNDLAEFTNVANVLGVGGKSDSATMTDYMGTMYGIFKAGANKIGKVKWVKKLAGQTATAIQMFKTTGSKWAASWTAIGANATSAGVGVAEQMAVLGKLQSTMSGSEAGTKYKAFLAGVGKAQDKLNLSFVDSHGNLLPMLDILNKLKGKFGDTMSVAESDALKNAFGSDEAVSLVKLLMADTDGLAKSMDKLGKVKGMEKAMEMASKRVTPLQRITQGIKGVTIALGQGLNPALDPLINGMADAAATMTGWMTKFPNITRWIGYGILAVLGLIAVMGALSMAVGISKLAMVGLTPAIAAAKWAMALFTKQGLIAKGVMWLVNAAMAANPAVLITMAILGLVAAVAAAIYWWDDLKAAFLDTSWGKAIMKVIDMVMGSFKALTNPIGFVAEKIGGIAGFFGFGGDDTSTSSPSLDATKRTATVPGGMTKHIANTVANNSTNSRTIGKQEINIHTPVDRQTLQELDWMGA